MEDSEERKRSAEEQIAQAIALLREKMPANFILIYLDGSEVQAMGAFSLKSAQVMLDHAIRAVSEQYAYQRASENVRSA